MRKKEKKLAEPTSMERKEELVGGGRGKQERRLFPPGFRFCPTDQELVKYYLIPWVEQRPLPFPIPLLDVYGTEPSRLPKDLTYSVHGEFYCFARRTRCSENGTRAKRTVRRPAAGDDQEATSGTWHANSNPEDIKVGGKVVAKRRLLSFQAGGSEKNSSWVMHEYCLEDSSKFQEVVLCKIRNRKADREEGTPPSSPSKRKRAAENTGMDAGESQGGMTTPASENGGQALMAAEPQGGTHQLPTNPAGPLPDGFSNVLQRLLAIERQNCGPLLAEAAVCTTAPVQSARRVDRNPLTHLQRRLSGTSSGNLRNDSYCMRPELGDVSSELTHPSVSRDGPPATPWLPRAMIETDPTSEIMLAQLAASFARPMPQSSARQIICGCHRVVQGHWPGLSPSPSPLTVPAMPAYGQRPDGPNPPAFFNGYTPTQLALLPIVDGCNAQPPTLSCMPINAVPSAPGPEQGGTNRPGNTNRTKPAHEEAELMRNRDDSDLSDVVREVWMGEARLLHPPRARRREEGEEGRDQTNHQFTSTTTKSHDL